jgi:tetratricopeptide (TPR) repeat protein
MFDQSIAFFRRAIALDPNYAGPYAGIAWAYIMDYQNHWTDSHETALDQADHFVGEAIAKDDRDPFGHWVAAMLGFWRKDYERWSDEAEKALSLNPNYSLAHNMQGLVHLFSGEPASAIPHIERAIRLDPAQHVYRHFLGTAYFVAGNYETAAAVFKDRIALTPTTDLSRASLRRRWAIWAVRKRPARFGMSLRRSILHIRWPTTSAGCHLKTLLTPISLPTDCVRRAWGSSCSAQIQHCCCWHEADMRARLPFGR